MHTVRGLFAIVPAAIVFAACRSTEPNAMHHVSVSAAIATPSVQPGAGLTADLIVEGDGGSVSISSAQIVLSRLKLANNEACADDDADDGTEVDDQHGMAVVRSDQPDDDDDGDDTGEDHDGNGGDHDCPPLKVGPVLVDLPLDGTTTVVLDALVPAGTYTRLQARLHAVKPGDAGAADFLAAHPDLDGISVKVLGKFTDAGGTDHDFTFTSRMNVVSAIDFDTPVTVDATTTNLTIDVDVASWFTTASGAVIDPTNSANQRAIEQNIRRSLRAFEDDDHDGDDDHGHGAHDAHP